MKIKMIRKICLALLLAVIFSGTLSASVYAAKEPTAAYNNENYIVWQLSDDGNTLEGNGKTYTYYEMPIYPKNLSSCIYSYFNGADNSDCYYRVESYDRDGEFVWLDVISYTLATKEGKAHLDKFFSGEEQTYLLTYGYRNMSKLDKSLIESLRTAYRSSRDRQSFNVTTLTRYDSYTLVACDTYGVIGYDIGTMFDIDGETYFVDHESLDNSYFSSEGELSFRKGSVELLKLDGDLLAKVYDAISSSEYRDIEFKSEYNWENHVDESVDLGLVWYGFICPTGGVASGVVLANVKALGKPKRWYFVSALSALALALAAIIASLA